MIIDFLKKHIFTMSQLIGLFFMKTKNEKFFRLKISGIYGTKVRP